MSMLILKILEILQTLEGLGTLVIEDTLERTVVHGLEVSVTSEGSIVLVLLLVVVLSSEMLI